MAILRQETSEASPIISLTYNLRDIPGDIAGSGSRVRPDALPDLRRCSWKPGRWRQQVFGGQKSGKRPAERMVPGDLQGVRLISTDGWGNCLNLGQKHHHHMNILEATVLGDYTGPKRVSVLTSKPRKFHHLQGIG